ncbi:MAG TPA: hypothetical protein VNL77_03005 [Roseiflexaceae bacterium]|nr:hypothetical protein [Roseiflexaceae bacterium]
MTLQKRTAQLWLLRTAGALMLACGALCGGTGQALAHDDDTEVVTYGPGACVAIADLPAYPGATCRKHKTELDDGVTETTSSYVTADSANTVRLAFEQAFARHGWAVVKAKHDLEDQEWDYTVVKGQRRIKIEVEPQEPHEGTGTEFSIETR